MFCFYSAVRIPLLALGWQFDKTGAAPRDVAKLVAAGVLNPPKKVKIAAGSFVGATEHDASEL